MVNSSSSLDRLDRLRRRLFTELLHDAWKCPTPVSPSHSKWMVEASVKGSAQSTPVDVLVVPGEARGLNPLSPVLKSLFSGRKSLVTLRATDEHGQLHDFGNETHAIPLAGARRSVIYAAALTAVDRRSVRAVCVVPRNAEDINLAMAASDISGAPLCLWALDHQRFPDPDIPLPLLREFLEKCSLRFAPDAGLRDTWEKRYTLPFAVLPELVPESLVREAPLPCRELKSHGALLGCTLNDDNIQRFADLLQASGDQLECYFDCQEPCRDHTPAAWEAAGITPHTSASISEMASAIAIHPFVVVLASGQQASGLGHSAVPAFPSQLMLSLAAAHAPILVVGNDRTPAATFVRQQAIGEVVPYDASAFKSASARLRRPEVQAEIREKARQLAPSLSDKGVGEWLFLSTALGKLQGERFEKLFQREVAVGSLQ